MTTPSQKLASQKAPAPPASERDAAIRAQQRRFIREATRLCDWTPTEMARAAGLAPSTINRLLNQEVAHVLSTKTQAALLAALEKRLAEFDQETPPETLARLRRLAGMAPPLADRGSRGGGALDIVGRVQAGSYAPALEWPLDDRYPGPLSADPRYGSLAQFALLVCGNSMDELYPHDSVVGCVRFQDLQRGPLPGEIVVTWRRDPHHDGGEATLKELRLAPDGSYWLWPRSSDPSHRPLKLEGFDDGSADNDDVVVIALVTAGWRAEPRRDQAPADES